MVEFFAEKREGTYQSTHISDLMPQNIGCTAAQLA